LGECWTKTSLDFLRVGLYFPYPNPKTPFLAAFLLKPPQSNLVAIKNNHIMTKQYPWPTVRLAVLLEIIGTSEDFVTSEIRGKLQEGVYWFRTPGSMRILYNLSLIRDWLANGECPAHQKAVKRYLASLPSSDVA
jgi:hypothetical protein